MSDVAASHVELGAGSERRMINRLAAYWEQLRGERTFPSMRDIEANQLEEIRSNCFVLDISESVDEPVIRFIGDALSEGGTVARSGDPLAGVSKRSLFGRISEHFLECIANGAPVGIEAEFDDDKGETILYRGVVVPFSDDDEHIDFVLGAVNCKAKG
ncbi:MAG TPA: PAS domain-containing protein, partial [Alphaproteobacteria bacterium]|nr:PAS domain-containing protein [Alphaproteobacteria bacterium]